MSVNPLPPLPSMTPSAQLASTLASQLPEDMKARMAETLNEKIEAGATSPTAEFKTAAEQQLAILFLLAKAFGSTSTLGLSAEHATIFEEAIEALPSAYKVRETDSEALKMKRIGLAVKNLAKNLEVKEQYETAMEKAKAENKGGTMLDHFAEHVIASDLAGRTTNTNEAAIRLTLDGSESTIIIPLPQGELLAEPKEEPTKKRGKTEETVEQSPLTHSQRDQIKEKKEEALQSKKDDELAFRRGETVAQTVKGAVIKGIGEDRKSEQLMKEEAKRRKHEETGKEIREERIERGKENAADIQKDVTSHKKTQS